MLRNIANTALQPGRLRALLQRPGCFAVPETSDGLLGRMVAMAGFEAAFVGLLGSTLNRVGLPDETLITGTELVDNATRALGASGLPTVVDVGAGFGNPLNVRRTLQELARAGAAAVLLRDVEDPRPHRTSRAAIAVADMQAKLRAARDAADGLVLIAGLEDPAAADAPARAVRYRDAGADLVHVGSIHTLAQAQSLAAAIPGIPLTCSLLPRSEPDTEVLARLGMRLAFFPHCGALAALPAIEHTFAELARTGTVGHLRPHIADFRQFTDIAGLPHVQQLEQRYGVPDEQRIAL